REMNGIRGQVILGAGLVVQGAQQVARRLAAGGVAVDGEDIATVADFDVEALLDLAQVLVELATEAGEATVVVGLEGDCQGVGAGIQTGLQQLLSVMAFGRSIATLDDGENT